MSTKVTGCFVEGILQTEYGTSRRRIMKMLTHESLQSLAIGRESRRDGGASRSQRGGHHPHRWRRGGVIGKKDGIRDDHRGMGFLPAINTLLLLHFGT